MSVTLTSILVALPGGRGVRRRLGVGRVVGAGLLQGGTWLVLR